MIKKLYHRLLRRNGGEPSIPVRKLIRDTKSDISDVLAPDEVKKWKEDDEQNIHGLSKKEVDDILRKMLFNDMITDGSFLYAWNNHDAKGMENGSNKFSAITQAPLYKKNINDHEKSLYEDDMLDTIISDISKNKKVHIELGPESGDKFISYSDEWDPEHKHLRGKKYIGVDISGIYADMANKNVKKIGMIGESIPGDRFQHSVFDTEKDKIYYFFGGSICNLDIGSSYDLLHPEKNKTIMNLLNRMRSNQPLISTPLVLTYFEAPDKEDPEYQDKVDRLKATYGSKDSEKYYDEKTHHALSDFILSGLEALGLERSKLEFVIDYDDKHSPAMIKLGARFTEKTEIQVGYSKIVKEAGERIRAVKSQRFTKEEFGDMIRQAGFMIKYQKSHDGVAAAVLQSKLGMNDRFKKTRNRVYGLLIGTTLLTGGLLTKDILHQREIEKQKEKMDTEFASKQKMYFYGGHSYYELKSDAEKIEYIDKVADAVFENISVRYDLQTDEDGIKKIIRSYVKDKEILGRFSNTENYQYNIFDISDDFVKKYSDLLIEKDVDQMPYDHLKDYEQYFKDIIIDTNMLDEKMTILSGEQGAMPSGHMYIPDPSNGQTTYYSVIDLECVKNGTIRTLKEQKTIPVEGEDDFRLKRYLGDRTDVQSHYIKDGYLYVKVWEKRSYTYIRTASAHGYEEKKVLDPTIIAYDYFYQNRPVIHAAYEKFGAIYRDMSWNHDRENASTERWKKDSVKMMITKDLLQTGLLDEISPDSTQAIMAYLQGFVQRNADFLKKEGISSIPYASYQTRYGEAFENTGKLSENGLPILISYEDRNEYDFHYIGKFYSSQGNEYDLAEMTIEGKKYLYARDINQDLDSYHTQEGATITLLNYYLSRGKEVVKDFSNFNKKST